jgi:hypothetical protein
MRITIAERLHPFSHTPGVRMLIPCTAIEVQVFPAALIFSDLSGPIPKTIEKLSLNVTGIVEKFTALLDLERGEVRVWGEGAAGYFRYALFAHQGSIGIHLEKSSVSFTPSSLVTIVEARERESGSNLARLSLGNHKAQDWDLVCRRCEMEEIFPIWHHLGQLVNGQQEADYPPLKECMKQNKPEEIVAQFRTLFKLGFRGILSPTLEDHLFQGIALPAPKQGSPLFLLQKGAELIGSLFVDQLKILPALPPEFHCGRLLNASCAVGKVDVEWTKKAIRQMILRSSSSAEVVFQFPSGIRSFRLRQSNSDRGQKVQVGVLIRVEPAQQYFFDNFQS